MNDDPVEHAIILSTSFNGEPDIARISAVEDHLHEIAAPYGEHDGHDIGDGEYTMFFYTSDADCLAQVILDAIQDYPLPGKTIMTVREGKPGASSRLVEITQVKPLPPPITG